MGMVEELAGLRIGVTRAAEQAEGLVQIIAGRGGEVVLIPSLCLQDPPSWSPFDAAARTLPEGFDGILFTSTNAVVRTLGRVSALGLDPERLLRSLRVVVVGTATAEALASRGLLADVVPSEFHSEGVLAALDRAADGRLAGTRWFLPRALVARDVLPRGLEQRGAQVLVVPVYEVVAPDEPELILTQLEAGLDVVTFTSGSSVNNLRSLVGARWDELMRGVAVAALGPVTADACRAAGLAVVIQPREARMDALVDAIASWATSVDAQ